MTTERKTAYNSGLAKGGVSCFADTFVQAQTVVLRMNFCAKNPALRQAAKRQQQKFEKTTNSYRWTNSISCFYFTNCKMALKTDKRWTAGC